MFVCTIVARPFGEARTALNPALNVDARDLEEDGKLLAKEAPSTLRTLAQKFTAAYQLQPRSTYRPLIRQPLL